MKTAVSIPDDVLERADLPERTGKLPLAKLELVLAGIGVMLGR